LSWSWGVYVQSGIQLIKESWRDGLNECSRDVRDSLHVILQDHPLGGGQFRHWCKAASSWDGFLFFPSI
jgi:hypothetical protein